MDLADGVVAAESGQRVRRFAPLMNGQQPQRYAQAAEFAREFAQVAQPEIDLGRRVAMQAPLAGRGQEQGGDRAALGGRGQGGVVVRAQVGEKTKK